MMKQSSMFGTYEFPSYEEIMDAYAKEFANYILPKGDTIFGFWMQTLEGEGCPYNRSCTCPSGG